MSKTYQSFILVIFGFVLVANVRAANNQEPGSQGTGQDSQGMGTNQPIQNKNQIQTQNMGEDKQLKIQTQEDQGTETREGTNSGPQGSKKGLSENRSLVAQQIRALLETQSAAGGIGDQVRTWAKTQQQSELRIQEHLTKIENKTGMARSLFGPNYGALNALKQEINQNKVKIEQLEQLKLQLTNQSDITNVQKMIELLNQENTVLLDKIKLEESDNGVFGWLIKLLAK